MRTPEDLKDVKMWMWEQDPVAEAMFKAMRISPIPLSITDVLTSLQTKLIDGVYTSPYAVIALQWFTRVKYMLNVPLADASGAIVISKTKYDELPPDLQRILLANGKRFMKQLTQSSRQENSKSIETLKKHGVTVIDSPAAEVLKSYDEIGKEARRLLVGRLYPQELLNKVEQAVSEYRGNSHKSSK